MPQKGLTIGGKAVTVQLAPGTGGQKTVTILSSAAASGVQKTLTQADLPPGHKIVMIQPKRNDGSNVVTHKTISEPLNAYSTDINLMDNNLDSANEQHIEQMDGAHDNNGMTDAKETSGSSNERGSNSDEEEVIGHIAPGIVGLMKKKTSRKSKNIGALHKHQPKFVKMGLFGGSPAAPALTTPTSTAGSQGATSSDVDHSEESTNPSQDESEFEGGVQDSQNAQSSMLNDHQALSSSDVNEPLTSNSGDQSENQTNERFDNEPTASETEAANILTIIKSGELLLSRNDETTATSAAGQTNGDGNVTILFNNEPHTTKGSSVSASPVSSANTKTIQKSVAFTSNTGHLDALASAALQASTNESNETAPTSGGNEFNANTPTKQRGVIRHRRTTIESRDEVTLQTFSSYNDILLNFINFF